MNEDIEVIPRKSSTHKNIDLTKPVNGNEVMAADIEQHGESCFSYMWDVTTEKCSLCHDCDMCGIQFHKRLKKRVKKFEDENETTLDMNDFDGINKDTLMIWLKRQERTFVEFVAKVDEMANCADKETVRLWARSFIKDNPLLGIKEGIVIFKR